MAKFDNVYNVCRPNKKGTGVEFQFQFQNHSDNLKVQEKYRKFCVFLEAAAQNPDTTVENATFNWAEKITAKLGVKDIGEMLAVLTRQSPSCTLFHNNEKNGEVLDSKIIGLANTKADPQKNKDGPLQFHLTLSKKTDKEAAKRHSVFINIDEACVLRVLLEEALKKMHKL